MRIRFGCLVLLAAASVACAWPLATTEFSRQIRREGAVAVAAKWLAEEGYAQLPPIVLVSERDLKSKDLRDVTGRKLRSGQISAFRISRPDGTVEEPIYIVDSTDVFRDAARGDRTAVAMLATTIAHEVAHSESSSERPAIEAELALLRKWSRDFRKFSSLDHERFRDQIRVLERYLADISRNTAGVCFFAFPVLTMENRNRYNEVKTATLLN